MRSQRKRKGLTVARTKRMTRKRERRKRERRKRTRRRRRRKVIIRKKGNRGTKEAKGRKRSWKGKEKRSWKEETRRRGSKKKGIQWKGFWCKEGFPGLLNPGLMLDSAIAPTCLPVPLTCARLRQPWQTRSLMYVPEKAVRPPCPYLRSKRKSVLSLACEN